MKSAGSMKSFKEFLKVDSEPQLTNLVEGFNYKNPLFHPDNSLLGNACFYRDNFYLIIEANRTPDDLLFCMVDSDNNFKPFISPTIEKARDSDSVGPIVSATGGRTIVAFDTNGMVGGVIGSIVEKSINGYGVKGFTFDDMIYSNRNMKDGDFRYTWDSIAFSIESFKGKDVLLKQKEFTDFEVNLIKKLAFASSKKVKFGKVKSDEIVYFSKNKLEASPTLYYVQFS
jgi:hypothetical protein